MNPFQIVEIILLGVVLYRLRLFGWFLLLFWIPLVLSIKVLLIVIPITFILILLTIRHKRGQRIQGGGDGNYR
jgi:hypothetical protein